MWKISLLFHLDLEASKQHSISLSVSFWSSYRSEDFDILPLWTRSTQKLLVSPLFSFVEKFVLRTLSCYPLTTPPSSHVTNFFSGMVVREGYKKSVEFDVWLAYLKSLKCQINSFVGYFRIYGTLMIIFIH